MNHLCERFQVMHRFEGMLIASLTLISVLTGCTSDEVEPVQDRTEEIVSAESDLYDIGMNCGIAAALFSLSFNIQLQLEADHITEEQFSDRIELSRLAWLHTTFQGGITAQDIRQIQDSIRDVGIANNDDYLAAVGELVARCKKEGVPIAFTTFPGLGG